MEIEIKVNITPQQLSLIHILTSFQVNIPSTMRKSPHTVIKLDKLSPLLAGLPKKTSRFTARAVSYTHLDVYKRQGKTGFNVTPPDSNSPESSLNVESAAPETKALEEPSSKMCIRDRGGNSRYAL